ncbi:MFS transporter [Massilia sp. Dwa41.01b]|uniref:peptide MFS transporter n=1 Tax=unclassified Massilia TaxID=2609279 RepID=UPI0016011257|nr:MULTISPECIES: oligopeptide:H+ symporter [unclassified Massilia]QNA89370.1 MFS transporter [Massilia sp. Dwa41.01b]QNB00265.1 MFS transporter [Massilia sp. Se16.2.3]
MKTEILPYSQTRSFVTVWLIELWERFGYYGMQALIVYFMVQRMGFDDSRANLVWGAAAALIYVAPAIGGWIGDKVLGTRRCMFLGAIILSLGYALMAIPTTNTWFLFSALGVIVVGNGLFKPNTANLIRKIYEGDDSKIDSAFTMYYMAVNVGSTVSMLATPAIKDYFNATHGNEIGWHVAYAFCSVGLVVGILTGLMMRATIRHVGSLPDERPLDMTKLAMVLAGGVVAVGLSAVILQYQSLARVFVYLAGLVVLGIFVHLIRKSEASERAGLVAALVLTLQTVFFFIFYQQMSTSLSLFALRNVDLEFTLFGAHLWTWSPAQFQALNAIWIMVLSPVLAWMYSRAGRTGSDLSIAGKFVLGFAVVAAGFFTYGVAGQFAVNGLTSSWIMIAGYGLYSLGELLVSGLGLAMVARYVPARMGGFMMGAYFVATGISQYLGGVVANLAAVPEGMSDPLQTLPIYTSLFNKLGIAAVICTLIALSVLPMMRRLTATHNAHQ